MGAHRQKHRRDFGLICFQDLFVGGETVAGESNRGSIRIRTALRI
ncbi:hypothetical protein SAMN05428967_3062 [Phyllobacterium sp. YR620]|nr:hypothetical protein SAMN05428967_3062 [Phyllobacterium sp. YR620]SFI55324.1 hypothetical protein SAMN04515648_0461 [Phyllobacterium sp. CL33Tsu]